MAADSGTTQPTAPEHRAPDIRYRQIPELPGVSLFDCERLHATLTTGNCTTRWRSAHARGNERERERCSACRGCSIGAHHAGLDATPMLGRFCCRCQEPAARLIWDLICISCYNRQREFVIGRNARGLTPVRLRPLAARRVGFLEQGAVTVKRMALTASSSEVLLATLRHARHAVAFGWHPGHGLRQGRLF